MKNIGAIVLAAGKGTRIKAQLRNKVLYPLAGKPMIGYTAELLKNTDVFPIVMVVGFKKQKLMRYLGSGFIFLDQGRLLGTGHAVKKAIDVLPKQTKEVLVLYGDHSAFYTPKMMKDFMRHHRKSKAVMTFLSVDKRSPTGYGRIIRDENGKVTGIREEKDATDEEMKIKEINTGAYCFKVGFLRSYLPKIKKNPVKGEYYITDLVELAINDGLNVGAIKVDDELVSLGINTLGELKEADRRMRERLNR